MNPDQKSLYKDVMLENCISLASVGEEGFVGRWSDCLKSEIHKYLLKGEQICFPATFYYGDIIHESGLG